MTRLVFGRDVVAIPLDSAPPAGQPFVPPPQLTVKVDPHMRSEQDHAVVSAELRNPTAGALHVAIVGPTPFITNATRDEVLFVHALGRARPVRVELQTLVVPAESSIVFENRIPWDTLCYDGTPTVTLVWQFMLAGAPIHGEFPVLLPGRRSRDAYFVDGEPVSEASFEQRVASLAERASSYDEHSAEGGQSAWTAKDASGRRYKIVHDLRAGWHFHELYVVDDRSP